MKKSLVAAVGVAIGSTLAFAMGILNLPPGPVTVTHGTWPNGTFGTTLDITLSDVPPGYDVMNGTYPGWCIEDNHQPDQGAGAMANLLDSTDTDPLVCDPFGYPDVPWDKVNYLLNHKNGTKFEIQAAMWLIAGTDDDDGIPPGPTFPVNGVVQAMVDDANTYGGGFVPAPGQVTAVIICADGIDNGYPYLQDTIIEVAYLHGCTPGYWKQEHHFDSWPADVDPDTATVSGVFGVLPSMGDALLLKDALALKGGGEKAFLRHAVAAYLNSKNDDVVYFFDTLEVIGIVQEVYWSTGDFEGAKDLLAEQNELFCPLD